MDNNPFSKLAKRSSIAVEQPHLQGPSRIGESRFVSTNFQPSAVPENTHSTPRSSSHDSRFPVYGLDWTSSAQSDIAKIAVSSFREDSTNRLKIIKGSPIYIDDEQNGTKTTDAYEFTSMAEITVNYPITRLQWDPSMPLYPDVTCVATTSECLRVYELLEPDPSQSYAQSPRIIEKMTLTNSKTKNFNQLPPLTSFDWNKTDSRHIITSSIDSTCTLWDISRGTGVAKTQLIAHDSEVFDVKFLHGNKHVFTSCSNDGSIRVFDLRSLEHSTIIYEPQSTRSSIASIATLSSAQDAAMGQRVPLLRLATSNYNANQIAAIEADSNRILILDLRYPETPIEILRHHVAPVNSIAWHPSKNFLLTGADDCQVLIYDLTTCGQPENSVAPCFGFFDEMEVNNVCWNTDGSWVAANSGRRTQAVALM